MRELSFSSRLLSWASCRWRCRYWAFLDLLHEVVKDSLVEVFSSQVSVAVGSNDFEDTVVDG
jgi:hypothetical protein